MYKGRFVSVHLLASPPYMIFQDWDCEEHLSRWLNNTFFTCKIPFSPMEYLSPEPAMNGGRLVALIDSFRCRYPQSFYGTLSKERLYTQIRTILSSNWHNYCLFWFCNVHVLLLSSPSYDRVA